LVRHFPVRRASPEVRPSVRAWFCHLCAHAWGEMLQTLVGSSSVGSDGRHGMADPGVGFGDYYAYLGIL